MAIKMEVLTTYDGNEGFVHAGQIVEVQDKQRAVFLQQFGLAKPVDEEELQLDHVYTADELKHMRKAELEAIAKGLFVEGYTKMTNGEKAAAILAAQEAANQDNGTDGDPDQDPAADSNE